MPPLNRLNKIAIAIALSQAVALPINAATISVDTTDDTQVTGTCSLRSAIEAANNNEVVLGCVAGSVTGNDTIDLTGLSNGSTITLTEPLPTVVSTVTINGSGQNNLSISGAYEFPIL